MSIYGDYAAQIIQNRRSQELQEQARRDSDARRHGNGKSSSRPSGRGARSAATGRARAV